MTFLRLAFGASGEIRVMAEGMPSVRTLHCAGGPSPTSSGWKIWFGPLKAASECSKEITAPPSEKQIPKNAQRHKNLRRIAGG